MEPFIIVMSVLGIAISFVFVIYIFVSLNENADDIKYLEESSLEGLSKISSKYESLDSKINALSEILGYEFKKDCFVKVVKK